MSVTLDEVIRTLTTGDTVTAEGNDTRGHRVTKTGVLLDHPKWVTAQRDGERVNGVRLVIGQPGDDPRRFRHWLTVFPDDDWKIERVAEPAEDRPVPPQGRTILDDDPIASIIKGENIPGLENLIYMMKAASTLKAQASWSRVLRERLRELGR